MKLPHTLMSLQPVYQLPLRGSKSLEKKSTFFKERDDLKRADFIKELQRYPPEKLVLIDESGIDKFISREYGRGSLINEMD
jgi:hypothetical protein